jgi:hypothetical protein
MSSFAEALQARPVSPRQPNVRWTTPSGWSRRPAIRVPVGRIESGAVSTARLASRDQSAASPGNAQTVRSWPLLVLALPAAVAVWSGWGRHRPADRVRTSPSAPGDLGLSPSRHRDDTASRRGGLLRLRAAGMARLQRDRVGAGHAGSPAGPRSAHSWHGPRPCNAQLADRVGRQVIRRSGHSQQCRRCVADLAAPGGTTVTANAGIPRSYLATRGPGLDKRCAMLQGEVEASGTAGRKRLGS